MLIGEYIHTIDIKNRISLPAKFRKEIGKKVIITPGLEECLFVFTAGEWKKISEKLSGDEAGPSFLKRDKRNFNRYIFGRAAEAEVDSIGRILIPDFLKEKIQLSDKVAIVGVKDRLEIWNDKTWLEHNRRIEKEADQLAEKLSSEGK